MDLPDDVARYIERSFTIEGCRQVAACLEKIYTPRVLRSVLYLADGSVSMLKHYAARAQSDIREIVLAAEYETGISATPMRLRDMSLPFGHEQNLGPNWQRRGPAKAPRKVLFHEELIGERFKLGDVRYVVLKEQTSASHVFLRRYAELNSRVVKLPLIFVLEQLAETIEMVG
ncbi:MAG: hypothetical protein GKR90_09645 [Pseudomonadales bacterium]|nr:hypothetical protein [Pseudomonadales bacterium]